MRHFFALLLAVALAFTPIENARATPNKTIPAIPPVMLTFDVYVGGIHFVTSEILFQEQGKKYHARGTASTYGFWHRLAPWDTLLEADGRIVGDHFVPTKFHNRDLWRDKPKVTDLRFDKKGNVTPAFDPPETINPDKREIVTPEQRHGSLDPVTALLQMLAHLAIYQDCAVTVPVFDGKRRFDVSGSDAGEQDVSDKDYGVYEGPARLCNLDFKMIAGEWKDRKPARFWQKNDTEAGRDPFQIWLATLDPTLPELPVRLETSSVFGDVVIHLSKWQFAKMDVPGATK